MSHIFLRGGVFYEEQEHRFYIYFILKLVILGLFCTASRSCSIKIAVYAAKKGEKA
jgi:hypothetical protein